ncbi:MAG: hypothetical protein M3Y72_20260, partial [Acidobacteriota bacterium]|nr:hypothetical protein [Acidobacteriota bacterium]
ELWFAKIQRDVIRRGVFTSVADLGSKLRRYIRAYSKSAKPFPSHNTPPALKTSSQILRLRETIAKKVGETGARE